MTAPPIGPPDLLAACDHVVAALSNRTAADWSTPVPDLDWDVRATVEHLVDAIGFYVLHLLPPSRERLHIDVVCHDGLSNDQVLRILTTEARGLATAAKLVDPTARAFHFHGTTDVSGFMALGCSELLLHGHDATRGLGTALEPRPDLAAKVLTRLVPSAPTDADPWPALLWATGRGSLDGYPDVGPNWTYRTTPASAGDL